MKLILKWLLSATALMALASIDSGVEVQGFGSALIAALVIGLFNLVVRPVLVVLTLPVTLVSLGLFFVCDQCRAFLGRLGRVGRLSGTQLWARLAGLLGLFRHGHRDRLSAGALVPAARFVRCVAASR